MSQPVLNLLERHAVGKQEGGAAMPEIVEAHLFYAVPLDEGGKLRGQIIGPHPLAQLIYKYKTVVFVVAAVAADLLIQFLCRLNLRKVFIESSHQRQGAHTGFGFCRLLLDDMRFPTHIDGGHRPFDGQRSPLKVDGVPLESSTSFGRCSPSCP